MKTGDCVVCFANSMNGPSVFQKMAEPIVGDIKPLFQWLSKYCAFKDVNRPKKPYLIASTANSILLLARKERIDESKKVADRFKDAIQQVRTHYTESTISSRAHDRERVEPSPLETAPKTPWRP